MSGEGVKNESGVRRPAFLRVDTLADSVVILLIMTIVQRSVGFVRGVLVCRWLEPEELGQWDMVFGFLMISAPLAVLSLPGAFGRYLEYYRQRGQLRAFLLRTTCACTVLALTTVTIICLNATGFSQLVFGRPDRAHLIMLAAGALVSVVGYNYTTTLFTALRYYRISTALVFLQSMSFAVLSLTLLATWRKGAESLLIGFGVASLVVTLIALLFLFKDRGSYQRESAATQPTVFWRKLVPFALWVWVIDLSMNLFDIVDRYMILHFSRMDATEALVQIGHYHSSRIVPLLFVAFAVMFGSMIVPHLSHDWERGRRDTVAGHTRLSLKAFGFVMSTGGAIVLLASPFLFGVIFQGKYNGGLSILPWTLIYCIWFGMMIIAEKYLWCAEKARLVSLGVLIGLFVNIGLNLLLLPRLGLLGAVLSTTVANAVAFLLICLMGHWEGLKLDFGTFAAMAMPLVLQLGPWPALGVLALVAVAAATGDRLLSPADKKVLRETCGEYLARVKQFRNRRTAPA